MVMTSCKQDAAERDAKLQGKLTGTWVLEYTPLASNFESTIFIDSNRNYAVHGQRLTLSNKIYTFEIGGKYTVVNGWLIDTVTNHSMWTNKAHSPYVVSNQIVRLTDQELILKFDEVTNQVEVIFRKKEK